MLLRLFVGICFLLPVTGCASGAHRLFGTSNPAVRVEKNIFGTYVEVGTEFQGKAKGSYNQETKEFTVDVEVNSSPSPVITAEGERIAHMEKIREMEFNMLLEQTKAMTSMVQGTVDALGKAVSVISGTVGNVIRPGSSQ